MEEVIVEKLFEDTQIPRRATSNSAGLDVCAYLKDRTVKGFLSTNHTTPLIVGSGIRIGPGDRVAIPLGFKAQLPAGWEAQVRTRSGLALKEGLVVANSPGTIDADYPDEWMVILMNTSSQVLTINHGDRVAQVVLAQLAPALPWTEGTVGRTTERAGGFGSTGK